MNTKLQILAAEKKRAEAEVEEKPVEDVDSDGDDEKKPFKNGMDMFAAELDMGSDNFDVRYYHLCLFLLKKGITFYLFFLLILTSQIILIFICYETFNL